MMNPANDRTSVAYWLERFPACGYGQGQLFVMIDELTNDPPLPRGLSEGEVAARLEACKRLVYPHRYVSEVEKQIQVNEKSEARNRKKNQKTRPQRQFSL